MRTVLLLLQITTTTTPQLLTHTVTMRLTLTRTQLVRTQKRSLQTRPCTQPVLLQITTALPSPTKQ